LEQEHPGGNEADGEELHPRKWANVRSCAMTHLTLLADFRWPRS
jgi:hypothetical protein